MGNPRKTRLTPHGRAIISEAQTKRWQEYRERKAKAQAKKAERAEKRRESRSAQKAGR